MPHVGGGRRRISQLECTARAISVHDYQKTHYPNSSEPPAVCYIGPWKAMESFFLASFCLPYFFVLFFYLVFPPQLGVLSQVQSRDVFPGSLVQIGVACCHLCVRAYSDQQVQRRPSGQPSGRAATSPFDNDVFAFSSWCLQFYQQVSNLWWSHTRSIFSLRSAVITFWCRTASPCQSSRFTFNIKLRY